jgi:hypothetical protein
MQIVHSFPQKKNAEETYALHKQIIIDRKNASFPLRNAMFAHERMKRFFIGIL